MSKKNPKQKAKAKQKKQAKQQKQQQQQKTEEKEQKPTKERQEILSRRELLKKWNVRLGPEGYIPGPPNAPKSFTIHEFSMMDPGGGRELLHRTELKIAEGHIYGLVGKNGFGKTTLLKMMKNYEIEGFPTHIRMLLVNQEEELSDLMVVDAVLKADDIRERLLLEEERLTRIQTELPETEEKQYDEINELLNIIWQTNEDLNYDQSERKAMSILTGLGFTKEMVKKTTKDLSGGWQMRVKLAKALFVEPDLMLLDEPTNHLDFPTVLWLQNYLKNYGKTVVVVSHDREFLNAVCTHTIHLTQKKLLYYRGNYETMLKTSEMQLTEQVSEYEALKKQIKEIKSWIEKYKDKGTNMAAAVASKRKVLEKMEEEAELLEPPRSSKALTFKFPDVGRLEDYVCRMTNVQFKYPNMEHMLLQNITFQIDMDSRVGMIGANGVGKSTLVKLIMGKIQPLEGDCLRNRQARIALFTQYHIDQLNLEQSAVEFICERFAEDELLKQEKDKVQFVRGQLGRFQLTGQQHTQQMKYLSGGQKSRVAFCVATWSMPHFLIMDEPTNHLDMETIDSLTEAIKTFHGGVLLISHDQYFLANVAREFWAVTPEKIRRFEEFENAKQFALGERLKEVEKEEEDEKV